jgi:hypothetical protein
MRAGNPSWEGCSLRDRNDNIGLMPLTLAHVKAMNVDANIAMT